MLTGPDVSDNQGPRVDWRAVAASNHAFAIARASSGFRLGDGSLYVDPSYRRNMEGMTAAGLVTGAYHYAYVTTTDPRTQADHFCDATAAAKPHIYFLDLEEGSGDLSQWALQFMTRVQERTGKRCGLYSGLFFASSHLTDAGLASFPLWLADYTSRRPAAPPPWRDFTLWQHTSSAVVTGIGSGVDESYFNGGYHELRVLAGLGGGGNVLNAPVVGMAPSHDGQGYYEVAADGGVFCFGDAQFHGSLSGQTLNAPIVGIAVHPEGGYVLFGADGGVFVFGDVPFQGSLAGVTLNMPVVGGGITPDGGGYWLVGADGGVFAFGDAPFLGRVGVQANS